MRLKRMTKKAVAGLAAVALICVNTTIYAGAAVNNANVFPVETNNWQGWPQAPDISSGTGILLDAKTGQILYDKGMDDQRYPASITKIMTSLVAIENSTPETQVTFTQTGMADAYSGSSNIIPQLGETFTMEQCIYMIMLKSANDVSSQVAETIGGSVENFVNMMNQKAEELGCINTHFNNANGLPDENHYTSAHDMALIAQAALKNETFQKVANTREYVVPATNLSGARDYANHHKMLLEGTNWSYTGCVGGKTGYTDASQSTLVTYAERDGLELIAVVMYGLGDDAVYGDTTLLMDYGFTNFKVNEDGKIQTADNKIIYENTALTKKEYEKKTAEPTPSEEPKDTSEPEKDSVIADSDTTIKRADMGAYIAMGVLAGLVFLGIVLIVVILVKNKKNERT